MNLCYCTLLALLCSSPFTLEGAITSSTSSDQTKKVEESPTPSSASLLELNIKHNQVILSDGTGWEVQPQDKNLIRDWLQKDEIKVIADNTQNSHYTTSLHNLNANTIAYARPIETAPVLRANPAAPAKAYSAASYSKSGWVNSVDSQGRSFSLNDGTVWNVTTESFAEVLKWKVGDKVRVRKSSNRDYPFRVTNYTTHKEVFAILIKAKTIPETTNVQVNTVTPAVNRVNVNGVRVVDPTPLNDPLQRRPYNQPGNQIGPNRERYQDPYLKEDSFKEEYGFPNER